MSARRPSHSLKRIPVPPPPPSPSLLLGRTRAPPVAEPVSETAAINDEPAIDEPVDPESGRLSSLLSSSLVAWGHVTLHEEKEKDWARSLRSNVSGVDELRTFSDQRRVNQRQPQQPMHEILEDDVWIASESPVVPSDGSSLSAFHPSMNEGNDRLGLENLTLGIAFEMKAKRERQRMEVGRIDTQVFTPHKPAEYTSPYSVARVKRRTARDRWKEYESLYGIGDESIQRKSRANPTVLAIAADDIKAKRERRRQPWMAAHSRKPTPKKKAVAAPSLTNIPRIDDALLDSWKERTRGTALDESQVMPQHDLWRSMQRAGHGGQPTHVPALAHLTAFAGFTPMMRLEFVGMSIVCLPADGERLFDQGQFGDAMYVVVTGAVEVRKRQEGGGKEVTVARLESGETFGEMALLTGAPRAASVVVAERHSGPPTSLLSVSSADFSGSLCQYLHQKRLMEMIAFLGHEPFPFSNLSQNDRLKLAYCVKRTRFAAGSVVVSEGDEVDGIYIVVKGVARVMKSLNGLSDTKRTELLSGRNHVRLGVLREGDCFGVRAALTKRVHGASLVALAKMEFVFINEFDFVQQVPTETKERLLIRDPHMPDDLCTLYKKQQSLRRWIGGQRYVTRSKMKDPVVSAMANSLIE